MPRVQRDAVEDDFAAAAGQRQQVDLVIDRYDEGFAIGRFDFHRCEKDHDPLRRVYRRIGDGERECACVRRVAAAAGDGQGTNV